jgi:hypothetical protein
LLRHAYIAVVLGLARGWLFVLLALLPPTRDANNVSIFREEARNTCLVQTRSAEDFHFGHPVLHYILIRATLQSANIDRSMIQRSRELADMWAKGGDGAANGDLAGMKAHQVRSACRLHGTPPGNKSKTAFDCTILFIFYC